MGLSLTVGGAAARVGASGRIFVATLVLNIADAILHLATDQVEVLRILSNLLLIVTSTVLIFRPT